MTQHEIQIKFEQLTSNILGNKKLKEVMLLINNFERLNEIRCVMECLEKEKNVN